jgi:hypothetical protein
VKQGDRGPEVAALQKSLNGLFWSKLLKLPAPLVEDGDFGGKTAEALNAFQDAAFDAHGIAGKATMMLLARGAELLTPPTETVTDKPGVAALRVALQWHTAQSLQEDAGSNRGSVLDRLEARFNLKGLPWCGMFVGVCCIDADLKVLPVKADMPAVAGWRLWAKKRGILYPANGSYKPQPGDLFCTGKIVNGKLIPDQHIGFVEKFDGMAITTIEGNAGSPGRVRSIPRPAFGGTMTDYIAL